MNKTVCFITILMVLLVGLLTVSSASHSITQQLHFGRAVIVNSFEGGIDVKSIQDWLSSSKERGERWIDKEINETIDTDKLTVLEGALYESKMIDTDRFITEKEDGTVELEIPLSLCELTFNDGTIAMTDKEGFYSYDCLSPGNHSVVVTKECMTIGICEIFISDDSCLINDIRLERPFVMTEM